MPSDITGTDVLEEDHATGRRVVPLRQGPDLRQPRPRRRDQPHAAQDPGRAAAVDAGVPRHRGRHDLRAAAAVPRVRDAEPDRAGGHLSAARGAARSLHVPGRRRLPERGRGRGDRHASRRAITAPELARVLSPRADPRAAGAGAARARPPTTSCSYAVALARATRPDRADRAGRSCASTCRGAPGRAPRST